MADCLSRAPISTVTLGVIYCSLATSQAPIARHLRPLVCCNGSLPGQLDPGTRCPPLLYNMFHSQPSLCPRPNFCHQVFKALHSPAHLGICMSQLLTGGQFMSNSMPWDIPALTLAYKPYQLRRVQYHHWRAVQPILVHDEPFSHVHMDNVGPYGPPRDTPTF